ncbi:hypothetical protein LPJ61_004849 [Coemansia biformis]|uniref:Uncharacterized protein n=1 Tax=Coemansia biformis TaxID=1286918 RepID=A0A9W8CUY6_9FUNG|nr:hypothetical protein LPJ61_004849 [Coemansia biformis]
MERMTAVNIVPNRKLVSGVVRSVSTELEMAKSDSRLCGAVAVAAAKAVASFVDITRSKIASITVNPSVLDPLGWPAHPLTKSYVGLVNAVDALRRGIAEVGGGEDAAGDGQTPWATKRRMSVMARRRPRQSSARSSWAGSFAAVAPPASGSPGTPGFADDAGSRAASAQQAIGSCLLDLAAFVDEHVDVLLGTADRAITGAIVDGASTGATSRAASAEDEASTPGRADVEQAMQWLQTQVLELLETDCLLQVGTMVDGYMRLYVRAVCLTFPLTEAEKLRLTAEVTQFEFASSQLVGSAGSPARRREKLTLDGLGSSFQSLRLMRPLLFTRSAELANILDSSSAGSVAEAGGIDAGGNWRQIPLLDMLDHTVCRLATEACAPDEGFDRALQYLPNGILGCTRRQWMACVSACDGLDIAWESTVDICKNPAMRDVWRGGVDMRASCRAVLRESLSRLSGRIQRGADEGIGMLAKAAEHALAADSG